MMSVFNEHDALERCFRSRKMLQQMIQCFFKDFDTLLPRLRAAAQAGDLTEVGRLGHRLKGTVVYLGADSAVEAAVAVERFERFPGKPAEAKAAVTEFAAACEALKAALVELRSEDWKT
jgi:HPt (histidine-containing phosphotransfer) domain-containing protein